MQTLIFTYFQDRSGDEAAGSGYSEDDDDDDDQDDEEDETEESEEDKIDEQPKNSPEKVTTSSPRARVNFDNLPVVNEEEELKRENKENCPENNQHPKTIPAASFPFPYDRVDSLTTTGSFGYQTDCPFVFPTTLGNSNILDGNYLLMTPQPPKSETHLGFDIGTQNSHQTPPPPAGWQNNLGGDASSNFAQSPGRLTTQAVVENDRSLADRRRAFFTLSGDASDDKGGAIDEGAMESRAKHFFAPLNTRLPALGDEADSPGSEKTASTVVSRSHFKGSAIPLTIDQGDAKAFFSTENLLDVNKKSGSSSGSSNPLTKSVSCQDLSSRLSFTENLKTHAKSDSTLDNVSVSSKPFRSQLTVVLKQPFRRSPSPDVPEIPQLPSIDYKLFNNPFLQNFEQAYQNFPLRTEGQSPVTHPLSIQVCESPVSGASYSSPVRMQPSFGGSCPPDADCTSCKRKDLERPRLTMPDTPKQEYQVTSFETPSPHSLQMPPMTPYELEALRRMPTGTSPLPKLYQNVPFVPRGATVFCPGQRMYYDAAAAKVPAQTQTSPEDESVTPKSQAPEKRRSRKEKSGGSVKEKRASQRRSKDPLKKQNSVAKESARDESRSSSPGRESSPRKSGLDQTKRVSLHFSAKKRPSISSVRTSRSRSIERERTNSVSSREQQPAPPPAVVMSKNKSRRNSTSSGSVPWCACWGNGCV